MEGQGQGAGGESEEQVMSEVHLGCPPHFSGSYVTHFTFPLSPIGDFFLILPLILNPRISLNQRTIRRFDAADSFGTQIISLDNDGDLMLTRRKVTCSMCKLSFQHRITSSLPNVGLQVWMAALLLADYVLHRSFISSDFNNITALELGAGTGLVGIVLARVAKTVFLTDCGNEVLDNCAINVHLSSSFIKLNDASIYVRELNWKESWPPHAEASLRSKYSWTTSEVAKVEEATVILAADVIYSNDLTESLFSILEKLMSRSSEKILYLALEKRYNFSLDDLDVVANGYARFRSLFKYEEESKMPDDVPLPCFVGEQIDIYKIPQYIREYERGKELELWRIRYCTQRSQLNSSAIQKC